MMRHKYGPICESCGARLDPGEKCDCRDAVRDRGRDKPGRRRPAMKAPVKRRAAHK